MLIIRPKPLQLNWMGFLKRSFDKHSIISVLEPQDHFGQDENFDIESLVIEDTQLFWIQTVHSHYSLWQHTPAWQKYNTSRIRSRDTNLLCSISQEKVQINFHLILHWLISWKDITFNISGILILIPCKGHSYVCVKSIKNIGGFVFFFAFFF